MHFFEKAFQGANNAIILAKKNTKKKIRHVSRKLQPID